MKFLEKDLEDIIFDSIKDETDKYELVERGLVHIESVYYAAKQVRIGNYGVADLITMQRADGLLDIHVYELKRDMVGIESLIKCARYAKGIKSYMTTRFPRIRINVNCVLIGSKIDGNSDWIYLFDTVMSGVSVYTYEYGLRGLEFDLHSMNYSLITEGFNLNFR